MQYIKLYLNINDTILELINRTYASLSCRLSKCASEGEYATIIYINNIAYDFTEALLRYDKIKCKCAMESAVVCVVVFVSRGFHVCSGLVQQIRTKP